MSIASQIFKIDTMVTFLWLLKRVYFFDSPGRVGLRHDKMCEKSR